MTHNTNKDSIEAPRLQPLYFHGHTEQLCPELILQGLVSTGTGQLSLQETELESVQMIIYQVTMRQIYSDLWVMCYVIITMLSWVQHHYEYGASSQRTDIPVEEMGCGHCQAEPEDL